MRWGKGSARLYPEPLDVIKSYQLQSVEQLKKTLKYFLISFLVRHFYSCLNFSFSKNYTGRNGKRYNSPWHQRPNTSSGVDWFRFLTTILYVTEQSDFFFTFGLILRIIRKTEVLYGRQHMTFNIHLLSQFIQSVGCIWAQSTFIPEWFNGDSITSANGTQK